ncbi:unnamed protein product, partial [Staurois parvus]
PFVASAINHQVPAGDSSRQYSVIVDYLQRGTDLCINNTDLSPVSSCTLLCMVLHSRAS